MINGFRTYHFQPLPNVSLKMFANLKNVHWNGEKSVVTFTYLHNSQYDMVAGAYTFYLAAEMLPRTPLFLTVSSSTVLIL